MSIFENKSNVIEYTVNKEVNNGIYISVQNGEVLVNAPWYMSQNQIQQIVEEKRKWILSKISEYEMEKKNKRRFHNKQIHLLGKEYTLNINYIDVQTPEANLTKNSVEIILPKKYKKVDNTEILKLVINKVYSCVAEKEIEMSMEKARILTGIAPEDYKIEKIDSAIAKCEEGIITINPDIVYYEREIIEYIIIHEFCHLKYKTHSKRFMSLIEKYVPNYKKYDEQLNNYKF